ncbi:TRAP transporter small permease [Billgrantia kenyensis]|uniref:TRAP transporter small permease protein n=1 Tax=Billgrantia kenyensis TaxID=321266 RepID=A0A7V9W3S8_9GAMM|nr:TRAP transporter small permease subunit [Halomonas kenyensis]MBA2780440.1 TRAP transporter small permease subunit [Halomonas kenyensis]MCG6663352.1 TRAP transporter small permease subunit [Halomonas kenyensis]
MPTTNTTPRPPHPLLERLIALGKLLDSIIIKLCAALAGVMVLIVWFGILSRYGLQLGVGWTEVLARYVMIWAALLAIPVGVFRREHIGFVMLFSLISPAKQRLLRLLLDLIGLGFFLFLAWYGIGMAAQGATQFATIFGMTMLVPFASVPVSAGLAALQTLIVMLRDFFHPPEVGLHELPMEEAK